MKPSQHDILEDVVRTGPTYALEISERLYKKGLYKNSKSAYPFVWETLKSLAKEGYLYRIEDRNKLRVRKVSHIASTKGIAELFSVKARELSSDMNEKNLTKLLDKYALLIPILSGFWKALKRAGLVDWYSSNILFAKIRERMETERKERIGFVEEFETVFPREERDGLEEKVKEWKREIQESVIGDFFVALYDPQYVGSRLGRGKSGFLGRLTKYTDFLRLHPDIFDLVFSNLEREIQSEGRKLWDVEMAARELARAVARDSSLPSILSSDFNKESECHLAMHFLEGGQDVPKQQFLDRLREARITDPEGILQTMINDKWVSEPQPGLLRSQRYL